MIDFVMITSKDFIEKLEILDVTGKKVLEKKGTENSVMVNVEHLPKAIYIALIETNKNLETVKLIKKSGNFWIILQDFSCIFFRNNPYDSFGVCAYLCCKRFNLNV
jgi:hypothetical protein